MCSDDSGYQFVTQAVKDCFDQAHVVGITFERLDVVTRAIIRFIEELARIILASRSGLIVV